MKWLTAADIDNWTNINPRRAQETLPLLIWKLITATYPHIIDSHFPYGKAVQFSGYDGCLTLEVNGSSSFCPEGTSVWEMGTDKDILSKFKGDYQKRTNTPNGINTSVTTFCFVTSRIWNSKTGIVETTAEKNDERIWKSVKILDANSLEQWLDCCPSVSIWFSNVIGKPYNNAYDIQTYWRKMVQSTSPELNTSYFLLNRKSVASQLLEFVNGQIKQVLLVAPSSQEALLTLSADLSAAEDQGLVNLAEKCIVVETPEALQTIDVNYDGIILIPNFHLDSPVVNTFKNILLLPVNQFDPYDLSNKSGHRITIPPRSRHDFCEAIETLGYDANQAYQLGKDLRCNFPALLRKISINPLSNTPNWSQESGIIHLIPALLAGKWEEKYPGDKDILSKLAGIPYVDFIAPISSQIRNVNYPIFGLDKSYSCISILEMWNILFPHVSEKHLDIFEECFNQVFSESSPKYELSEDKWFMSHVYGKDSIYSNSLKEGMITTLVMLMEQSREEEISTFSPGVSPRCRLMVQNVLSSVSTLNHWRSICPYLPLLTEAVPNVVLARFQKAIQSDEAEFWGLFTDPKDFLTTETFYPDILHSLEIAMWDITSASLSLHILLSIAEKNYSYRLANNPLNTLYSVFCLWCPQGIFTSKQRKTLIEFILQQHHQIGVQLVQKLLDDGSQITIGIQFPIWRSVDYTEPSITDQEFKEKWAFTAKTYLTYIQPNFTDWNVVLDNLSAFGPTEDIIKLYRNKPIASSLNDVLQFCTKLCHQISDGRKFGGATPKSLDMLEQLYHEILPDIPKSYSQYFSYNFYGFNPTPYRVDDPDPFQDDATIFSFRCKKIQELTLKHGLHAVLDIIPDIEDKPLYAGVLAHMVLQDKFDWPFIQQVKERDEFTASSIISHIFYSSGLSAITIHADELDSADLGWVLSCCKPSEELLDFIDSKNSPACSQKYWENMQLSSVPRSDKIIVKRVISGCLQFHRPYSLIKWLAYVPFAESDSIISVLDNVLRQFPESEPNGITLQSINNGSIQRLFKKLYSAENVDSQKISYLELGYITLFDSAFEPKFLVDTLLSHPDFYLEVLMAAFLSDCGESHPDHQNQVYAKKAQRALHLIRRLPGYDSISKTINNSQFTSWVNTVCKKAATLQYSKSNDRVLGLIFSYSPMGTDNMWPAECVRNQFERPHSSTLENAFINGLYNQRGMHTVTYGKDEDILANKYFTYAEKLQLLYPCTAEIIRKIGEVYQNEAKYERIQELNGYF